MSINFAIQQFQSDFFVENSFDSGFKSEKIYFACRSDNGFFQVSAGADKIITGEYDVDMQKGFILNQGNIACKTYYLLRFV